MATSPVEALLALRNLDGPLLLAVSGGGDSIALLHAAVEARRRAARFPALHALTVDHALRRDSAAEARFVAGACRRLDVPHGTARLEWTPPTTGTQARARHMRLSALRTAAMESGATILTGHTADDDAETMAMRLGRNGSDDAAEWAGIPPGLWLQPGWLLRPFLRQRRASLRDWLKARNATWIDDPFNEDETFERVRVRRTLAADPCETLDLIERATNANERRTALARNAATVIETDFRASCEGFGARIERRDRFAPEDNAAMLALRTVCAHVGGVTHLPSPAAAREAIVKVRQGSLAGMPRAATLARCLLTIYDEALHIVPEGRDWGAPRIAGYAVALGERNGEWRKPKRVPSACWSTPLFHGAWMPDDLPSGAPLWAPNRAIYSTNPNGTVSPRDAISRQTAPHGMIHAHHQMHVTTRPLVRAITPYAEFVPSPDLILAWALARLAGRPANLVPKGLPFDSERRPFEPR